VRDAVLVCMSTFAATRFPASKMTKWFGLLAIAAVAHAQGGGGSSGLAMLRFGCSELSIDRIDP
jgi:hypothetical protein